jgi:predicted lipoprotein with Yx(FWY)xxD motif
MISRIHQRLGTVGFVISIVALVAALSGGAYAAGGGLTGKQKKEVEKIAKNVSKPGKTGPSGPAGPTGATGPQGNAGASGVGTEGKEGKAGKSVLLKNEEPSGCEAEGLTGYTYEVEGSGKENEVCSSVARAAALPSVLHEGQTETGAWTTNPIGEGEEAWAPISFPISLGAELDETHVIIVQGNNPVPANCNDGVEPPPSVTHPEAKIGYLCVFRAPGTEVHVESIQNITESGSGASTTGAILNLFNEGSGAFRASGTFAVTGGIGQ